MRTVGVSIVAKCPDSGAAISTFGSSVGAPALRKCSSDANGVESMTTGSTGLPSDCRTSSAKSGRSWVSWLPMTTLLAASRWRASRWLRTFSGAASSSRSAVAEPSRAGAESARFAR